VPRHDAQEQDEGLFIWLIIRLFQFVFLAGTVFFSHIKSANVFQPAYQHSRTETKEQWQHSRPSPLPYFPYAANLPDQLKQVDEHDLAATPMAPQVS
jgi:hypothetical protein